MWGGPDGAEGEIDVAIPMSKGVAYRFPFSGNLYFSELICLLPSSKYSRRIKFFQLETMSQFTMGIICHLLIHLAVYLIIKRTEIQFLKI